MIPSMENFETVARAANCGACGRPMSQSQYLNLVSLSEYKITWKYPRAGNVLTNEGPWPSALVCDECIESNAEIKSALEIRDNEAIYHPVAELERV